MPSERGLPRPPALLRRRENFRVRAHSLGLQIAFWAVRKGKHGSRLLLVSAKLRSAMRKSSNILLPPPWVVNFGDDGKCSLFCRTGAILSMHPSNRKELARPFGTALFPDSSVEKRALGRGRGSEEEEEESHAMPSMLVP